MSFFFSLVERLHFMINTSTMSSISEQNSQTHFPATRHLETGVTMLAFLNDELFETHFI